MDSAVVVSNEYPVGNGSESNFIHAEVCELAAQHASIHVLFANAKGSQAHDTPSNVRYSPLYQRPRPGQSHLPSASVKRGLLSTIQDARRVRSFRHVARLVRAARSGARAARTIEQVSSGLPGKAHVLYFFWGAWGAYAIPWLDKSKFVIIVRFHGGDLYEWRSSGYLPYRQAILESADLTLSISKDGEAYLHDRYPAWVGPTQLSRLGAPDAGVSPYNNLGPLLVMSCASVIAVKRVDRILDALVEMAMAGRMIRWVHFGGGALLDALADRTTDLPRGLEVELRGQQTRDAINDFCRTNAVDVFVNTSESEGVPVSIMEAVSFDIPVVATAVGGTPEIVDEAEHVGVLVPGNFTNSELADAIMRAKELRVSHPGARREYWRTHYRRDENARAAVKAILQTKEQTVRRD